MVKEQHKDRSYKLARAMTEGREQVTIVITTVSIEGSIASMIAAQHEEVRRGHAGADKGRLIGHVKGAISERGYAGVKQLCYTKRG